MRTQISTFSIFIFIALSAAGQLVPPEVIEEVYVDDVWPGHPVGFALLTQGQRQYTAYYDDERQMVVASRRLGEAHWTKQPLDSRVGWDSHNSITLALDRQGHLHVTGNMHVDPLVYFRSETPYDVTTLTPLHKMTGALEERVTYPRFLKANRGRLLFMYRHGSSGDGLRLINRYDEAAQQWTRLIDAPLLNGREHNMNAYPSGIKKGPNGWFHLVWMWRDTPDAQTNHDISYVHSRDLVNWQSAGGEPVQLPITPENKEVVIDPVPSREGLINMGFGLGFDPQGRTVVHYHKYDSQGYSQIYLARWEEEAWQIYQPSAWEHRWEFGGGGSIPANVRAQPVRLLPDGRLVQSWSHEVHGNGTWVLDPETLKPVDQIQLPPKFPPELTRPESDFEDMQVRWQGDLGQSPTANAKFFLRWETLPRNRDRPREGPLPDPGELVLYKFQYPNN